MLQAHSAKKKHTQFTVKQNAITQTFYFSVHISEVWDYLHFFTFFCFGMQGTLLASFTAIMVVWYRILYSCGVPAIITRGLSSLARRHMYERTLHSLPRVVSFIETSRAH